MCEDIGNEGSLCEKHASYFARTDYVCISLKNESQYHQYFIIELTIFARRMYFLITSISKILHIVQIVIPYINQLGLYLVEQAVSLFLVTTRMKKQSYEFLYPCRNTTVPCKHLYPSFSVLVKRIHN